MDPFTAHRMDKTKFAVASLNEPTDEKIYWRNQTPKARLEALELLRQIMYAYDPVTDRLQRVLEVIKRSPG